MRGQAKAPVWVRIVLAVLAACALAVAALGAWNMVAAGRYNAAASALASLVEQAGAQNADVQGLQGQVREVRASLESLEQADGLLLPELRRDVRRNADVARELASRLEQEGSDGLDATQDQGTHSGQGQLTDAQRQQVEELLAGNGPEEDQENGQAPLGTDSSPSPAGTPTETPTVKPW